MANKGDKPERVTVVLNGTCNAGHMVSSVISVDRGSGSVGDSVQCPESGCPAGAWVTGTA